jgi:AraC-like DNA-binding protein
MQTAVASVLPARLARRRACHHSDGVRLDRGEERPAAGCQRGNCNAPVTLSTSIWHTILRSQRSRMSADCRVAILRGRSSGRRAFRPTSWLTKMRVERAKELLKNPRSQLADIALLCGFVDQSHFTRVFSRSEGYSPGRWRRLTADGPAGFLRTRIADQFSVPEMSANGSKAPF